MGRYVRASRCDITWCRAPHRPGDKPDHVARLGSWPLGGVTVEVCVGQVDPHPPVVRIVRHPAGGPRLVRDVDADFAVELANILDALSIHSSRDFSAVLRQAAAGVAVEESASREQPAAPSQHLM
ncbi:hypothetical protein ABZ912_05420 [Nonomuraea angiospora]|uniref:hypothetical protein n=1 Tax=Nonomuraea angiospora TaxID=46172 RepID=UPI0033FD4E3D